MDRRIALGLVAASLLMAFGQEAAKPVVVVLIGPLGAGKSTQAAMLKRRFKIPVISRDEVLKKSPDVDAGIRQQILALGKGKGFVLDGYPATHSEADALAAAVREAGLPSPIIVQIDVPESEVVERMAKAGGAESDGANVRREYARYQRELQLVRSYYPEADIWTINGKKTPAEVFQTIVSLIQDR